MSFTTFWHNLTSKKTVKVTISGDISEELPPIPETVRAKEFAIFSAISFAAAAFSTCEFRTFLKNKEMFSREYYRWNYHTNRNQSAAAWKYEFFARLLFYGRALAIESGENIIIADNSFSIIRDPILGDVFTGISRDGITIADKITRDKVIFCEHTIASAHAKIGELLQAYDDVIKLNEKVLSATAGEKGTYETTSPATGTIDEQKQQVDFVKSRFNAYFSAQSAVLPLFGGEKYTPHQNKNDGKSSESISKLVSDELIMAAQAFNIPPALFRGETTGVKELTKNFITFGIKPPASVVEQEINACINTRDGLEKGTRLMIDYTNIKYVDVFDVADKAEKLLYTSIFNADEILRKLGEPPRNTQQSREYIRSKNFEVTKEVK